LAVLGTTEQRANGKLHQRSTSLDRTNFHVLGVCHDV